MKVLIDGDVLAYRAAFSKESTTLGNSLGKIEELFEKIMEATDPYQTSEGYSLYLTGQGNYRFDIDPNYKANRIGTEKPVYLPLMYNHLVEKYGAIVVQGQEADDAIAIEATYLGPTEAIIASIDKDFLQVPSVNYNPGKDEWTTVTAQSGMEFFYTQILTGDRVDNVFGINKVGPVKAAKLLEGATTEQDLFAACVKAYGDDYDRMLSNARLLWLRRYEGQIWEPPTER